LIGATSSVVHDVLALLPRAMGDGVVSGGGWWWYRNREMMHTAKPHTNVVEALKPRNRMEQMTTSIIAATWAYSAMLLSMNLKMAARA
jgi:hypothetical protein